MLLRRPYRGRRAAPLPPRPLCASLLAGADGGGGGGLGVRLGVGCARCFPRARRAMPTVEELYRNYGILADATETAGQVRRGGGLRGLAGPGRAWGSSGAAGRAGELGPEGGGGGGCGKGLLQELDGGTGGC